MTKKAERKMKAVRCGGFELCERCGGEGRLYGGHPNDPDPVDRGECPVCNGTCREWVDDEMDNESAEARTQ